MTFFSRLFHIGVDLTLLSVCFAGLRRSTGLTVNREKIQNDEIRNAVAKYLDFGEWTFDQSAVMLRTKSWMKTA
ncbi:DUF1748 family protein [Schizosaccharomyces japonicus yFS275]|uniref:DUF1748 family protein n=1 Tax=Schizosaccharomyces japonicus (strain yFS275 / FY16936) TaxID=402676 RepID=B6K210_SCHJY|nr:DUF1748 family protein [Schizosaccharomyces japonicus yFS275]EEB07191.1 DUF1748 family protein [Schizosaccharomyces japonicus yFS275]